MRRVLATEMALAAAAFMTLPDALELANNVACWDACDVSQESIEGAIRHRMVNFGVHCGDVSMCAAAMADVARRFGGLLLEVA